MVQRFYHEKQFIQASPTLCCKLSRIITCSLEIFTTSSPFWFHPKHIMFELTQSNRCARKSELWNNRTWYINSAYRYAACTEKWISCMCDVNVRSLPEKWEDEHRRETWETNRFLWWHDIHMEVTDARRKHSGLQFWSQHIILTKPATCLQSSKLFWAFRDAALSSGNHFSMTVFSCSAAKFKQ